MSEIYITPDGRRGFRDLTARMRWLPVLLAGALGGAACFGQNAARTQHSGSTARSESALKQQYDAAQRAQSAGDFVAASRDYQAFLAAALARLADGHTHTGDYSGAVKLLDEALAAGVPDPLGKVRVAYAQAALLDHDVAKAKSLAQAVVAESPKNADARFVLGEALLKNDENDEARKQLEAAVALDPSYRNGLALAHAYLALANTKDAGRIFSEMAHGAGDKASLHLDFGRAYAEAGYPDLSIAEFKKAIAEDPTLPEAHYCLGASYLLSLGEAGFPKALEEFHRELALHPNDYFSLSQLGYIALSQHKLPEAENYLKRASALDAANPDNPLLLGQVYMQLNQPAEAEQAFRQAIALTTDLSRNHYQVQRAHYLLGRLLVQQGHADEAKQQMQIASDLLKQNMARDEARLKGAPIGETTGAPQLQSPAATVPADAKAKRELDGYTAQLAPALADSYNNLGVIAAGSNEFATASGYFAKAAQWNPALEGLDYNWGRAAFSGGLYASAIEPLNRYLAAHPHDDGARRVLGISYFQVKDYGSVVRTLKPLEGELAASPQLGSMYGLALARTGDYDDGIARLESLSKSSPTSADVHRALGEAYAGHGNYQQAAAEFNTTLQLNAADQEAREQLAALREHLAKQSTER